MRFIPLLLVSVAVAVLTIGFSPTGSNAVGRTGFGFRGTLSGIGTASAVLSGGGSYDPSSASNTIGDVTDVHSAGGFRCTSDVTHGPLSGCLAGQGVRWDTAQLLASTEFKCSASDAHHTVVTDKDTIVLLADFYRAGDGNDESFADVPMFVSANDERPDLPGVQNIWIAGVGCGDAIANFN